MNADAEERNELIGELVTPRDFVRWGASRFNEAGLFFVAAAYGLGFGGIIPAYVLTIRALYPASEASWRVPGLLFVSLSGMAFGAWLAGAIYDRVGFYAAAWWAGIAANILQLGLVAFLLLRLRRDAYSTMSR